MRPGVVGQDMVDRCDFSGGGFHVHKEHGVEVDRFNALPRTAFEGRARALNGQEIVDLGLGLRLLLLCFQDEFVCSTQLKARSAIFLVEFGLTQLLTTFLRNLAKFNQRRAGGSQKLGA